MAIRSGFFNSVNGDRRYDASRFAEYFSTFIGNGVFPNPSNGLQVTAETQMKVKIAPGKGWINGYYIINEDEYNLSLEPADGLKTRVDRVVLRLDYNTRDISIVIKKGTPSDSPAGATLQRNIDAYELCLAEISVKKGVLVLSQADILDTRLNTNLCGIVHGVVNQVDTTTIFNQYKAWFDDFSVDNELSFEQWRDNFENTSNDWFDDNKLSFEQWRDNFENTSNDWQEQSQIRFNLWFENIQNVLDGDTAGNLYNKINNLEGEMPKIILSQEQPENVDYNTFWFQEI